MSVAQWDNEYARLARSASQMRTTGLRISAADVRSLTIGLQQLEAELSRLNTKNNHSNNNNIISQSEIQRRRRLIQHLQQTTATLDTTTTTRTQTMQGNDFLGTTAATSIGDGGLPQQQQQKSQMATALQQQDVLIDQLAVGVSRLKNQTLAIGEEASLHVNLMTDMESGLDAAHEGLLAETRRAATLREDQSVWRLQLIVAGLSVLLLLLIFAGLSP